MQQEFLGSEPIDIDDAQVADFGLGGAAEAIASRRGAASLSQGDQGAPRRASPRSISASISCALGVAQMTAPAAIDSEQKAARNVESRAGAARVSRALAIWA